jgi:hypothetical protein
MGAIKDAGEEGEEDGGGDPEGLPSELVNWVLLSLLMHGSFSVRA